MSVLRKKALISDYSVVRKEPYWPQAWIGRGMTLLNLGYGELAVADAHKGRLLIEAFRAGEKRFFQDFLSGKVDTDTLVCRVYETVFIRVTTSSNWKGQAEAHQRIIAEFNEMEERALVTMIEGLNRIRALHDALVVAREAKRLFPKNALFEGYVQLLPFHQRALDEDCRSQGIHDPAVRRVGRLNRVQYPWIAQEEVGRSNKAIKKVKANIQAASDNAVLRTTPLCCGTEDSLGVFARRKIPKGKNFVLDKSTFSIFNDTAEANCNTCSTPLPGNTHALECCKVRYCSAICKAEALKSYHTTLCRKDFGWLYKEYSDADPLSNDMVPLLMLKVLATAIQQNARPLKVASVGTMHAGYGKQSRSYFKLMDNIIAPTKILQTLGVDIFTDRRFDSWVMQTLFLRIENNKQGFEFGRRTHSGLNPMFTMFNHACDPAALWWPEGGTVGAPVEVRAYRNIEEGEEICISYMDVDLPEIKRRRLVRSHIGKDCECARSLKERAAVAAGQPVDAFDLSGMAEIAVRSFKEQEKLKR